MPNYTPEAKCEEAKVLAVMISHARIGVSGTYTKIDARRFRKRPSEFIEYLNEAPGFLCSRESIEAWCGKAGWPRQEHCCNLGFMRPQKCHGSNP